MSSPSTSKHSSSEVAKKKQATISSFFGKSSTQSKTPKKLIADISSPISATQEDDSLFVDQAESPLTLRQTPKRSLQDAEILEDRESAAHDDEDEDVVSSGPKRQRSSQFESSQKPLQPVSANSKSKETIKVSDRTSKYLFSSSPVQNENDGLDEENVEAIRRQKERLHRKFVSRLSRPDSIAEIKRRNPWANDEGPAQDDGEEDEEGEEEEPQGKSRGTKNGGGRLKKVSNKLTPMEKQVLEIKAAHPDAMLVVEVGYKYRFFGEDARLAAKELGIVCIPGKLRYDEHPSEAHLDRFASASIPTHRLHVHVRRLVQAGHKVGVVRQLETAALKAAGDNRNAPFVRKLTNLYTKGTYIDDVEGLAGANGSTPAPADTGFLLCITETKSKGWGTDEKVQVGFVAVQPATGDVVYDDFEDGFMRSEVETRLLHISPVEFLIVGELSNATEKIVQHLSTNKTNVFGDRARVERTEKPKTMAAQAFTHVSTFYAEKMKTSSAENDSRASALLEKVLKLSDNVTICLSAMISHMADYGLEHVFDLTKYFQPFSARSHMLLNGTTLTSLEIYQNQTDHVEKGSLFWSLDRTQTRFGKRLLRKWVGRPLLDKCLLEQRVAAVEELKEQETGGTVGKLRELLSKTKSDLEKSLIRIYYGKCTRPELLTVLQTLQRVANEFADVSGPESTGLESSVLNEAIASLPLISEDVVDFLERINPEAAAKDDKYAFFREEHETGPIEDHKLGIAAVEHDLDLFRAEAAAKLKKKKIEYVSVGGIEYQIEVDTKTDLKHVPASWIKISGTKAKSRFHTPEVIKMMRERDKHKESLAAACDAAFAGLLDEIAAKYQGLRDCVQALATLDCLLSLARVAAQPGYVRPSYSDATEMRVEGGRHPMVEQLLLDAYVPNDIDLRGGGGDSDGASDGTRALLITGPNMGGKSSYVRSVALIAIMGQIGSYVPASAARLGMLDAVFTRMGAQDNMLRGESTFMVELSETADILKQATPRSLVILDELGRGTSTHDGVAIAHAVLDHVVRRTGCLTLFITHYQSLSAAASAFERDDGGAPALRNVHMSFEEHGGDDDGNGKGNGKGGKDSGSGGGSHELTFLYKVADGIAHRSYGLNVARLANVPDSVLALAAVKSRELEQAGNERRLRHLTRMLADSLGGRGELVDELAAAAEQL